MINASPKQLSDIELLITLCSLTDDEAHYTEFVDRFYNDLKSECIRICQARKLDKHEGTEIAHLVFEKVRRYKSFNADSVKAADSHKGILSYLTRIAVNLFNDRYRKQKKHDEHVFHKTYFEELSGPTPITDPQQLLAMKQKAVEALKKLNANEKQVVLKDIEFKKHSKYLPDDITEELSTLMGVKKDTIRKIRERAKIKLKKAFDEFEDC